MEPENQDESQVLETETTVETTETAEDTLSPEQIRELQAKAAKADELENTNKQLFERAKKAEATAKEKQQNDLSNKDLLYLAKADIYEDDMDEVLEIARLRKVSVSDAHKFMQPILNVRAEERRTANTTRTTGGARGASKIDGLDLLAKAESGGDLPDTDEGMAALAAARINRRNRRKR